MRCIAIIPARGGSKRIPRKNIKHFLGKPIIAYSIQAALKCKIFSEVMVSTDDDEIASISKELGAVVPFRRSDQNADDFSTTVDVIIEVVKEYELRGKEFEFGCCIYPTAPFIKSQRLIDGYEILISRKCDSVFPIAKFSYPIWRALHVENEKVSMIWPENMARRSQDLPDTFHDAGQWYWFDIKKVITNKRLWSENTYGLQVMETEVQDIDNESDWKVAEIKYLAQNDLL